MASTVTAAFGESTSKGMDGNVGDATATRGSGRGRDGT